MGDGAVGGVASRDLTDRLAGGEDERPPPTAQHACGARNCVAPTPVPSVPHPQALQRRGKVGGGLRRAERGQQLIVRRAPLHAYGWIPSTFLPCVCCTSTHWPALSTPVYSCCA